MGFPAAGAYGLSGTIGGDSSWFKKKGSSLGNAIFGNAPGVEQYGLMSPEQNQGMQSYFNNPITNDQGYQSGSNYLQKLLSGDPAAFSAFEAPIMEQFQEQTVPGIAERFAGMGAGSSSALYNSLAHAGRGLSKDIAQMRAGLQMQALPQALNYAQQPYSNLAAGMQFRPHENVYNPGTPGLLTSFLTGAGQAAGQAATTSMMGGA